MKKQNKGTISGMGVIYEVRNTINNKVYIGASTQYISRLKQWKSVLKSDKQNRYPSIENIKQDFLNTSLTGNILDSILFDIIEVCNIDVLFEREAYHISLAMESKYGCYNINNNQEGRTAKVARLIRAKKENIAKHILVPVKKELQTLQKGYTTYEAFNLKTGEYQLIKAKTRITYPQNATRDFHKKMGAKLFTKEAAKDST